MMLLIDAGNSRVKWGIWQDGQWLAQGAAGNGQLSELAAAWRGLPLAGAWGACVASDDVRGAIEAQFGGPINWVSTQAEGGGVRNHYHAPAQMGSDRWLSVLAARRLCGDDLVVACAGTALTIESLTREGDYLGGLIMPGYALMLAAMARNTARLDQPVGAWTDFPRCTEDAIASGVLEAMVGAIERARHKLAAHTGRPLPTVFVTGGDATRIGPQLASPARIVDNLVLLGLLEVADKSS
jgi:type III pantothenate kinase